MPLISPLMPVPRRTTIGVQHRKLEIKVQKHMSLENCEFGVIP